MPSIVTRPVITSMAPAIRLNWRTVVAVTWGWRQWKSVTISTIGEFRCGLRVVVLHNATLHDNGPPHLIFGEGIDIERHFLLSPCTFSPTVSTLVAPTFAKSLGAAQWPLD